MIKQTDTGIDVKSLMNWFGNRDVDIKIGNRTRFKVVGTWLFIHNSAYKEVELYALGDNYGECVDSWGAKGFNWKKENLLNIIEEWV
tara:strand:+ start:568 stop:828 length:261 start_codon:yes stop_codon:yes gene_type:complete